MDALDDRSSLQSVEDLLPRLKKIAAKMRAVAERTAKQLAVGK